jgi:hypothetical protein
MLNSFNNETIKSEEIIDKINALDKEIDMDLVIDNINNKILENYLLQLENLIDQLRDKLDSVEKLWDIIVKVEDAKFLSELKEKLNYSDIEITYDEARGMFILKFPHLNKEVYIKHKYNAEKLFDILDNEEKASFDLDNIFIVSIDNQTIEIPAFSTKYLKGANTKENVMNEIINFIEKNIDLNEKNNSTDNQQPQLNITY